MAGNTELQAKIAAISGRISQHKQQPPHPFFQPPPRVYQDRQQPAHSYRGTARWSPYGRGGRAGFQAAHKHRTLVLNGTSTPPPIAYDSPGSGVSPALVSSRGSTNQLMTKNTYDREQNQRLEQKQQQRAAKRHKRNTQDQYRVLDYLDSTGAATSRELDVNGIRFQLADDGSKLTRVPDIDSLTKETPKKTSVAGVDFHRTKHGNLIRASALKAPVRPTSNRPQCENFTKHGTCPYGPRCHFAHDPDKVAICKDIVKTGSCALGANCDLSHEMTYHRVPACQYFLRSNCTNTACRYPHVLVSPSAPVCRSFATLGFCAKGSDCDKRHLHECPDHANSGVCAKRESGECTLPHPERASIMRKAAGRQAKFGLGGDSDVSSDEENDNDESMEDIDSDAEDVIMMGSGDDRHELSQQHDFVGFN